MGKVEFIVLMQSHFVDEMPSALIAPLIREPRSGDFTRVSVAVRLNGEPLHLSLAEMAPIAGSDLKRHVGSLKQAEDDIRRALDRLFTGFRDDRPHPAPCWIEARLDPVGWSRPTWPPSEPPTSRLS